MGRGLNALFGMQGTDRGGVREIPVDLLLANPDQPRVDFDEQTLVELADSIRANGIIQPLVARPHGDQYQLVTGERRLRAARIAGLSQVPVVVRQDLGDEEVLLLGLIENLQREDLNPVEEARCLDRLLDSSGATQEELARRLGKSRTHLTNTLRLLKLPDEVLGWLRKGRLTAGHARTLLGLDLPEQMIDVARTVIEESWNVRRLEAFVKEYTSRRDEKRETENPRPPRRRKLRKYQTACEALIHYLDTPVSIRHPEKGRGRIVIEFEDRDQLEDLLGRIGEIRLED